MDGTATPPQMTLLSLDRVRELAGLPDMSDTDAEEFRRAAYELAELAIELWELELRGEWTYNDPRDFEGN